MRNYSSAVILLYAFFVLVFTVGLRLQMRLLWQALAKPISTRRAAILCSGATEVMILVLQQQTSLDAVPVAVIDVDPAADGLRIHGVSVHYAGEDVPRLLRKIRADLVVVPSGEELTDGNQHILEQCREAGVPIQQFEIGMSPWTGDSHTAKLTSYATA
jgi:FlaA1/EpsC-like NDP-sugar epimerase